MPGDARRATQQSNTGQLFSLPLASLRIHHVMSAENVNATQLTVLGSKSGTASAACELRPVVALEGKLVETGDVMVAQMSCIAIRCFQGCEMVREPSCTLLKS